MRAVRVWITNALNDGKFAAVVKFLEAFQRAVKTDLVGQSQNIVRLQADFRPGLMVKIIRVRHNGVDAVVTAGHLQHDENCRVLAGGDLRRRIAGLRLQRRKRVGEKRRHGPRQRAAENGAAQKFAARLKGNFIFHKVIGE